MSVYKFDNSPYWHYDFQIKGHRFRGPTKTKNRKEAEAVEKAAKEQARDEIKQMERTGNAPLTLDAACHRYWEEKGITHTNAATTFTDLQRLSSYFGKDKLLEAITTVEARELRDWRKAQTLKGRTLDKAGNPVKLISNATVNRSTTLVLKKLFTRAKREWGYQFPKEPKWHDLWLDEGKKRPRELKATESAALRLSTRDDYAPLFEFERLTGLRLRENLLTWENVNWETLTITTIGKGRKTITTPITSPVKAILEPLKDHHPVYVFTYVAKRTRKADASYKGDGEARERGKRYPITYTGLVSQWKGTRKKAVIAEPSLANFRFHDFRHDFATKFLRETRDIKLTKEVMNHSRIETTELYAHVMDEDKRNALETFGSSQGRGANPQKNPQTKKKGAA